MIIKELNIINLKNISDLKDKRKDTFENLSKNTQGVPLVNSQKQAYNFDLLHRDYCDRNKKQRSNTADALVCQNNTYYFIEFKNSTLTTDDDMESLYRKMQNSPMNLGYLLYEYSKVERSDDINYMNKKFVAIYSSSHFANRIKDINNNTNTVNVNNEHRNRNVNELQYEKKIEENNEKLQEMMINFEGYPYEKTICLGHKKFDELINRIFKQKNF